MVKTYMNWSGGKDSALALHEMLGSDLFEVKRLLTSMNASYDRISMHGVPRALLNEQAKSIGLDLDTIELQENPGMEEYETKMANKIFSLKDEGFEATVFGDIFLEDLRAYREKKMEQAGMKCLFPLWQKPSTELMDRFLDQGFRAIVVCVNERFLDKSFCGRMIDREFVNDLPGDLDVCGENGEYHSFVFDGPIFRYPLAVKKGKIVRRVYPAPKSADGDEGPVEYGFYFCDLLL